MKVSRFTKLFYAFQFFFDFIFIYAVEKLLFLNRGLDLTQIAILLFIWSVMSVILEIPSGALADRWSRRKILILSGLFFASCYFVWIFSNSFYLFLFGFFLRTIGATFASGTVQAYVYDFLKEHQVENKFEKIWGKGNALRLLGIGVAIALGGFLSEISYGFTLALSSLSVLSVSAIAFLWPEVESIKSTEEVKYWQFVRQAIKYAFTHPIILRAIIFLMFVPTTLGMLEEFNDVYLNFLGYPNYAIGIVLALSSGMQSMGSWVAFKFKRNAWLVMKITVILASMVLLTMAFVKNPIVALGLPILAFVYGLTAVLIEGIIQKQTESHQRATVTSASKIVMDLLPGQLAFGILATQYNLQIGYGVFGIFILFYFIFRHIPKARNLADSQQLL